MGIPYSKADQLRNNSQKLSQRQLGEISPKVDKQLKERSNGVYERCDAARAEERAHITGRKQIKHKTTVDDLLHLCVPCHNWLDQQPEGIRHRKSLTV